MSYCGYLMKEYFNEWGNQEKSVNKYGKAKAALKDRKPMDFNAALEKARRQNIKNTVKGAVLTAAGAAAIIARLNCGEHE